MLSIRQVVGIIKLAAMQDRQYAIIAGKGLEYTAVLSLLYKEGHIRGYEQRGNFMVISLKQTYGKGGGRPLKGLHSIVRARPIRNKLTISAKLWKKVIEQHGESYCQIINTDRGLKSNKAVSSCGGVPLLKVL